MLNSLLFSVKDRKYSGCFNKIKFIQLGKSVLTEMFNGLEEWFLGQVSKNFPLNYH